MNDERSQTYPNWLWPVVLVVLSLAAMFPVLRAEFLDWDDTHNVSANADFNPPSWRGLGRYWARPFEGLYVPVMYTVWMGAAWVSQLAHGPNHPLDAQLFHAVSLLVHLASVVLVYRILRMLLGDREGVAAALGAALFAVHPMQVETVAWVSGLKDLLGGMFALAAIWQYLKFAQDDAPPQERRSHYLLATAAFVAAILCKPSAIVAPVLAAILVVGMKNRTRIAFAARSLGPWLVLAIPIIVITRVAQPALLTRPLSPAWQRPQIAADALAFYLRKLVVPFPLAIDYGRSPDAVLADPLSRFTWIAPVVVALLSWMLWRRVRVLGIAALVLFVSLLPMLGLVPFDFQVYSTVADHYIYLAMLGPALAIAWVVHMMSSSAAAAIARGVVVAIIGLFALLSHRQARFWHDTGIAFHHTLAVNPKSWVSHINLSYYAILCDDPDAAVRHATIALSMRPSDASIHINLGMGLGMKGDVNGAIEQFRTAIRMAPNEPSAHSDLADVLVFQDKLEEAILEYHEAMRVDPKYRPARAGLERAQALQRERAKKPASRASSTSRTINVAPR